MELVQVLVVTHVVVVQLIVLLVVLMVQMVLQVHVKDVLVNVTDVLEAVVKLLVK